ncbi:hypothetical protein BJ508DRAFT_361186 [Ascobolus immersus RN42]|uniref:Uncharacterized protein n=1 Tax=Ascobolus immersus RN42 TaxID=1160509 RepID=A0A3N4I8R4_ASCIM|nr:hypothetical protein BJ508DRAFT_361186 [Ascobolus immersus RN42]
MKFFRSLTLLSLFALRALAQDEETTTTTDVSTTSSATATTTGSTEPTTTSTSTSSSSSSSNSVPSTKTTTSSFFDPSAPPDVYLNVPELSVGRIELNVDNLSADINLNAKIAQLVTINAGVQVSVQKINLTIADVRAELDLTVRLGHLVDIVNRVFESLDLNPLLIDVVNGVTDLIGDVVGAVDGLLGSITQGGKTLNFLIDNLGHIVQSVTEGEGSPVNTIVGDYLTNMTFQAGTEKKLNNGLVQKTYLFEPLNSLVDVVTNTAGQVVQAVVQKKNGGGGGSSTSSSSSATSTATSTTATSTSSSATATATEEPEETPEAQPVRGKGKAPHGHGHGKRK